MAGIEKRLGDLEGRNEAADNERIEKRLGNVEDRITEIEPIVRLVHEVDGKATRLQKLLDGHPDENSGKWVPGVVEQLDKAVDSLVAIRKLLSLAVHWGIRFGVSAFVLICSCFWWTANHLSKIVLALNAALNAIANSR